MYWKQCPAVRRIQSFVSFCIDSWSLVKCSKRHQTPLSSCGLNRTKASSLVPGGTSNDGFAWRMGMFGFSGFDFQSCIPNAESFRTVGLLCSWCYLEAGMVDGSEMRLPHQLRLVVYPIIYKVLYIPGACLGLQNHQQYHWNLCTREVSQFPLKRHKTWTHFGNHCIVFHSHHGDFRVNSLEKTSGEHHLEVYPELPPTQDSSHQDYEPFLGSGIPT